MANPPPIAGRIEGGLDAIVVGASLDGVVAAAMLARYGLKTVLVESDYRPVEADAPTIADGVALDAGDGPLMALDRDVAAQLDLYRYGLSFRFRRIRSAYRFDDGSLVIDSGDPRGFADALGGEDRALAEAIGPLMERLLDAGDRLARGLPADPDDPFARAPLEAVLATGAAEPRKQAIVLAETGLVRANRPDAPYTAMAAPARYSGRVASLQGALAYPEGGIRGLMNAVRRAGQGRGVDYRQSGRVRRALIEWDHVAGVEFEDGGQVRAPIVVSALPAATAFLEHIGAGRLDIEFAAMLRPRRIDHAILEGRLALEADAATALPAERYVRAPSIEALTAAYGACERGVPPTTPAASLFFPDGTPGEGVIPAFLTLAPYPAVDPEAEEEALRDQAAAIIRDMLGVEAVRVIGAQFETRPGRPVVEAERARLAALETSDAIDGYFFCGPEAELGPGPSGAAGARAAARAIDYWRKRR